MGTQKSIAPIIASIARKSSSNYINERWKGGFLTNFKTMKKNEDRFSEKGYQNEENLKTTKLENLDHEKTQPKSTSKVGLEFNRSTD